MRRFVNWLTIVHATDPLRCMLNRGLAIIIPIWIVLVILIVAALVASYTPLVRIGATALLIPAFAIVWRINRYSNTQNSATITTVLGILAVLAAVDIHKYLTPWGQPIIIDIPLMFPVLLGAFFASPWSAIWVIIAEVGLICADGTYIGLANDRIVNFAIFGPLTLLPVALIIVLLAQMYQKALAHSFDENARLLGLLNGYVSGLSDEANHRQIHRANDQRTQANAETHQDSLSGA